MKLLFILAILITSSLLYSAEDKAIFKKVQSSIFQIKTATHETSSKASYGTGFVVDKNGLLITNYHVVSTSLQEDEQKYNIYVVIKDKSVLAEVVAIDIIQDLALLKINKKFKSYLKLEKKKPTIGENIYSLGLPKDLKLSIVKGNYNGVLKYSIYDQILMSTPVNQGMSGGPTVNNKANVIGVNVSILRRSQNISFSVPIYHAQNLINSYRDNPDINPKKHIHKEVEKQLTIIDKTLIKDMKSNATQNSTLDKWHFAAPSKSLKCWSKSYKHTKKTYEVKSQVCRLQDGAYISSKIYSGNYGLTFRSIKNLKRNGFQFFSLIRTLYNSILNDYHLALPYSSNKELISKFGCDQILIKNAHNIPFKVNYCINSYMKYKNLYNVVFKGVSLLSKKESLVFNFNLEGFTPKSIKEFLSYQLNNIKFEGKL